tara:strand:- start:1909 stop:2520 length:612 start_codon:yes stop_codon:yes gene_type:complete
MEMQLRAAGALPEGYQSTYLEPTGPQGFLEGALNTFGLYKNDRAAELLPRAQANTALLSQAVANLRDQEAEETRDRTREEEAYDTESYLNTVRELQQTLGQQNLEAIREQGRVTTAENIRQARALFPLLDLAGQRGTERNLSASQRFRAFKEQLPLNVQRIMESKQGQQESAANAFLKEAQAMATQQQAANQFASLGLGRRFG